MQADVTFHPSLIDINSGMASKSQLIQESSSFESSLIDLSNAEEINPDDVVVNGWTLNEGTFSTNENASTLSFTYFGVHFIIFGNKGPNIGRIRIYLDGVFLTEENGQSDTPLTNVLLFSSEVYFSQNIILLDLEPINERHSVEIIFEQNEGDDEFYITHLYSTSNAESSTPDSPPDIGMIIGIVVGVIVVIVIAIVLIIFVIRKKKNENPQDSDQSSDQSSNVIPNNVEFDAEAVDFLDDSIQFKTEPFDTNTANLTYNENSDVPADIFNASDLEE